MKTQLYFFSGTGNSYYIAKKIGAALSDSVLTPINCLDLSNTIQTDAQIVGVIFPVYFLDAPKIVKEFLKKLVVNHSAYVFLYANFGALDGNALFNCTEILKSKDIKISSSFSLILPDNSIVFPTAPDSVQTVLDTAEEQLEKDIDTIKLLKTIPNPKKKLGSSFLSSIMRCVSVAYLGFNNLKADSAKCSSCGLCTKVCPMKNISIENSFPVFKDQCEMCFACIHYCPQECIKFKRMKPKDSYQCTNPHISLSEIIEKNRN